VGAVGVGIADALDDGGVAIIVEFLEGGEVGVQADVAVDLEDILGIVAESGAGAVVMVIGVGNDGVEAIIAAGELDDDEDGGVFAGGTLGAFDVERIGEGHHRLVEERGDGGRGGEDGQATLEEDATGGEVG